jgi:hypothetical protein
VNRYIGELEEARQKASNLDQLSAAVRAIEAKAKVSGLLVQRVEVGGAGDFSDCETVEAVAEKLLEEPQIRFRPVNEQDRAGLVDLLQRHGSEVLEYLAAINARPVTVSVVQSPSEARRRLGLLGSNGRP